jgi:AcrR family transcriptional regulator
MKTRYVTREAAVQSQVVNDRPLRADARRNRDALIRAAAEVFRTRGSDVALQEIAEAADLGIGTLYRHFPQREWLIAAVYEQTVEQLCAEAGELLTDHAADEAIDLWLNHFVEHVRTHRPMTIVLKEASSRTAHPSNGAADPGKPPVLLAKTHALLESTIAGLLASAEQQGLIRSDVEPMDLLRALGGLCQVNATQEQASRLIGLIVDGLRYRNTAAS